MIQITIRRIISRVVAVTFLGSVFSIARPRLALTYCSAVASLKRGRPKQLHGRCMAMAAWLLIACMSSAQADMALLPDLVRQTMATYFSRTPSAKPTAIPPGKMPLSPSGLSVTKSATQVQGKPSAMQAYQPLIRRYAARLPQRKPAGVFVTLSRGGKSRACWGSVYPQHPDVVESTVYATLGALTKEYRYRPITSGEWRTLKPQVTVVRAIEPITGLRGQNPLQDGLMVRAGGRSGVLLPGEARDAFYQLVQCKLKAGIHPGESYQLYRIIADVYQ